MGLSLVTGPSTEPITRDQAKTFLRVDNTTDDTLIDGLIKAARIYCENQTRRAFVSQTWEYTKNGFCGAIELPIMPVISVTSVSYVDPTGNTQIFTEGTSPDVPKYSVFTDAPRTLIEPKYNVTWPITQDVRNAVTVRFVAGYATVPQDIITAIYLLVAHWYDLREPVIVGTSVIEVPFSVSAILSSYQLRGF